MPDTLHGKQNGKEREIKKAKERQKTRRLLSMPDQLALDLAREWSSPGDPYQQHLYVE